MTESRPPAALLALMGMLAAFAAVPAAAPGARVLVLPFTVQVDSEASKPVGGAPYWLGEAAAILLGDDLDALGLGALSRADRIAAFERLQLPSHATLTHATMIRVGELIGASEIVVGDIHLGDQLTVHVRTVRLDAGRQLPEVTDQAPLSDLFALVDRLARRVAGDAARPLTALPALRPNPPIEAFENYVKGLVAATPAAQERFLLAALKTAPGYDRAQLALWGAQAAQGANDAALATAKSVSPISPLFRVARFSSALSLIELKRYDEAFPILDALYKERPSAVLSNALGVVQLRRGATPQTGLPVYYFNRAAEAEPDNADFLFNLGYAYARANDPQGALYWLRQAVRVEPANGDTHLILSATLVTSGKSMEAQREFDLAKLLGSLHTTDAATLTDRVPRGLERLRTDLDIAPGQRIVEALPSPAQRDQEDQAAFHLERGQRLFAQDQDREAIDELRRAVYLSPYQDVPHLLLGRLYRRAGRLNAAIDEFKLALWCRESVEAHLALGQALLDAGELEAARAEAQRALVMDPASADAKDLLKRSGGSGGQRPESAC